MVNIARYGYMYAQTPSLIRLHTSTKAHRSNSSSDPADTQTNISPSAGVIRSLHVLTPHQNHVIGPSVSPDTS